MEPRRLQWVVLLWIVASNATPLTAQHQWHTRPDKWKESRLFHTPFEDRYAERIGSSRTEPLSAYKFQRPSSNKAYWFGVNPTWPLPSREPNAEGFHFPQEAASVDIFNERDYVWRISFKDHYPNFVVTVRWINEKLLFVRVWWGRVLGTELILDVEREAILYQEMVNDGNIPFQQFQPPLTP